MGHGVNQTESGLFRFFLPIERYGKEKAVIARNRKPSKEKITIRRGCCRAKYGNLFQMYEKIVDDNPYKTPMMIYPCTLYYGRSLGGL